MSKAERIKETLGWLKIVFAALVAVAGTTAGIVAVNHAAIRRLAQLEDV